MGRAWSYNQPMSPVQRSPLPFDIEVGKRVRFRREELAISQSDLGRMLGLTYQQIHKYERGDNRISASKLYEMSKGLGVTCGWLMGEDGAPDGKGLPESVDNRAYKMLAAWRRLDPGSQDALLTLAKSLALNRT